MPSFNIFKEGILDVKHGARFNLQKASKNGYVHKNLSNMKYPACVKNEHAHLYGIIRRFHFS
jgi:hypothetical protein